MRPHDYPVVVYVVVDARGGPVVVHEDRTTVEAVAYVSTGSASGGVHGAVVTAS